jgi:hypothetical protein
MVAKRVIVSYITFLKSNPKVLPWSKRVPCHIKSSLYGSFIVGTSIVCIDIDRMAHFLRILLFLAYVAYYYAFCYHYTFNYD